MNTRDFSNFFKDPKTYPDDLVAVGGDLKADRLIYAYTHGIFPWSERPIRWYSLDPRAIFDLQNIHFSRSTLKKVKKNIYKITANQAFPQVMRGCSFRQNETTWISKGFIEAYTQLHDLGYAHSFEAWNSEGNLVGGVYGVAIGKFFAGESMFSFESDAGKISLYHLFSALRESDFELFDSQQINRVTWELGAYEISKLDYLNRLESALDQFQKWDPKKLQSQI